MSCEYGIDDWANFVRDEFDVDQIELVGEPIRLSASETLYVFESYEEDAVFILRSLAGARHEKADITSFGNGSYRMGLIKAIGLYSTPDIAVGNRFDEIFDTIDGTIAER